MIDISLLATARQQQQQLQLTDAEANCRALLANCGAEDDALPVRVLLAIVLMQGNRAQEAAELLPRIDGGTPADSAARSDLGLLYMLRGDLARARDLLEQATREAGDHAAYARLGALCTAQAELAAAETAYREALARSPGHPAILSNLGGVLMRQNKYTEALEVYATALRLEPGFFMAERGRTAALLMLERADELLAEYDAALEQDPGALPALTAKIQVLTLIERLDEAREVLRDVIELHPDALEYRLQLAGLHSREEQHRAALKVLREADERFPDLPAVLNPLARTLSEMHQNEEALQLAQRALDLKPGLTGTLLTRAHVHANEENYSEAEADLRKVLDTHPGIAEGWSLLGHILLWKGHLDEAVECMQKAAQINPGALASMVETRAIPEDPKVLEKMERFADHPLLPFEPRAAMNFALTKACEKRGDYAQAFIHANSANRLIRDNIKYDAERHRTQTDAIIRAFTPELFERFAGVGNYSERPIFVVGMPRSGTTLTEQLLGSHPEIFGAGELSYIVSITRLLPRVLKIRQPYPACMPRVVTRTVQHAAQYYLNGLNKRDREHRRVVDKMPHNFAHLGLIAILFPYAKIIHVRRDPRDIAISNYFTNFKMKRGGMGYAFDLAEIGRQLNDYRRIMDHWRAVLPVPLYEFNYEDLVAEPERQARALLEFAGVDWDPVVMNFYKQEHTVRTASVWQVRQPIYQTSRARWTHYEEYLEPLYTVLKEYAPAEPKQQGKKTAKARRARST